jgi:hypothetical protein
MRRWREIEVAVCGVDFVALNGADRLRARERGQRAQEDYGSNVKAM